MQTPLPVMGQHPGMLGLLKNPRGQNDEIGGYERKADLKQQNN